MNIAILQSDIEWKDISFNLSHYDDQIEHLSSSVNMVILPEMFSTGFTMDVESLAETMGGRTVQWMVDHAVSLQANLIGSLIIKEDAKYYNRLISVMPDGSFHFYNKKHLFSYAGEHLSFSAGSSSLVYPLNGWNIKPLICYDLRFPEWARHHGEVDILVYIASWPHKRIYHWDQLLKARAIENQCFVVGCNRVGHDGNGIEYNGHSTIIDYSGTELIEVQEDETIINWSIDLAGMKNYRKRFSFLADQDLS